MRYNIKISFKAHSSRSNKMGELPIYCRISIHGTRAEFSIGQRVASDRWDKTYQRAIGSRNDARFINDLIEDIRSEIWDLYKQDLRQGKEPSPSQLIRRYHGENDDEATQRYRWEQVMGGYIQF